MANFYAWLEGRKVTLYLVDSEDGLTGFFRGFGDGFVGISESRADDAPLTLIDRESIWSIVEVPSESGLS